jgi:hypothetical protein
MASAAFLRLSFLGFFLRAFKTSPQSNQPESALFCNSFSGCLPGPTSHERLVRQTDRKRGEAHSRSSVARFRVLLRSGNARTGRAIQDCQLLHKSGKNSLVDSVPSSFAERTRIQQLRPLLSDMDT